MRWSWRKNGAAVGQEHRKWRSSLLSRALARMHLPKKMNGCHSFCSIFWVTPGMECRGDDRVCQAGPKSCSLSLFWLLEAPEKRQHPIM